MKSLPAEVGGFVAQVNSESVERMSSFPCHDTADPAVSAFGICSRDRHRTMDRRSVVMVMQDPVAEGRATRGLRVAEGRMQWQQELQFSNAAATRNDSWFDDKVFRQSGNECWARKGEGTDGGVIGFRFGRRGRRSGFGGFSGSGGPTRVARDAGAEVVGL